MNGVDNAGVNPGGYSVPVLPRFSLAERDSRWAKVRALMARDGIDVILCFHNSTWWDWGNSYGRYLSHVGGNGSPFSVVFPREGDVTALAAPAPTSDYWLKAQDWVADVRTNFFDMTAMAMDRLKELGLTRARIGIAGLADVPRQPDGLVSWRTIERLKEDCPHAEIVNATALLAEARVVKSVEEIEMLRQAVGIVEKALDVMAEEARAGVPECVVYGRMVGCMIENGSEATGMLNFAAGDPTPPTTAFMPSERPLGPDDKIMIECEAKRAGYIGQISATHWVGEADDAAHAMAAFQYKAFQHCCEAMRPGVPFGDLVDICAELAEGTPYICKPLVHGRGQGMDGPVLVYEARDDRVKNWRIVENSSFMVKPVVFLPDGSQTILWGDSVVVTPSGAQRLGKRLPPLIKS